MWLINPIGTQPHSRTATHTPAHSHTVTRSHAEKKVAIAFKATVHPGRQIISNNPQLVYTVLLPLTTDQKSETGQLPFPASIASFHAC